MNKTDLRIEVLGTSLTISTDEDPEYLDKLLEKYKNTIENVRKASRLDEPLKIAILTGFLISHDLEKLEKSFSSPAQDQGDQGELEKLTMGMIKVLEEALVSAKDSSNTDTSNTIGKKAKDANPAIQTNSLFDDLADLSPADFPSENPAEDLMESPANYTAPKRDDLPKTNIYKLHNPVKNYEWGSTEWIPLLLNKENTAKNPWAELWMGVNPAGPSKIILPETEKEGPSLYELINNDPSVFLGRPVYEKYGKLPFLFKILAVGRPLSIQVHPDREDAKKGYKKENEMGLSIDSPERNYKDKHAKPEMLCALGSFIALCGFRNVLEIHTLLTKLSMLPGCEGINQLSLEKLLNALKGENSLPLGEFINALTSMDASSAIAFGRFVKSHIALLEMKYPENLNEWKLTAFFANLYPGDPMIMAPLFLNIVELSQGEAVFIPPGIPHLYIHGMAIELMADSDNVIRGGLSSKYIDTQDFNNIVKHTEYNPEILKKDDTEVSGEKVSGFIWHRYKSNAEEFSLSQIQNKTAVIDYQEKGPSIFIVMEGMAVFRDFESNTETLVKTGESVIIPSGMKLELRGNYKAYAACTGLPSDSTDFAESSE